MYIVNFCFFYDARIIIITTYYTLQTSIMIFCHVWYTCNMITSIHIPNKDMFMSWICYNWYKIITLNESYIYGRIDNYDLITCTLFYGAIIMCIIVITWSHQCIFLCVNQRVVNVSAIHGRDRWWRLYHTNTATIFSHVRSGHSVIVFQYSTQDSY